MYPTLFSEVPVIRDQLHTKNIYLLCALLLSLPSTAVSWNLLLKIYPSKTITFKVLSRNLVGEFKLKQPFIFYSVFSRVFAMYLCEISHTTFYLTGEKTEKKLIPPSTNSQSPLISNKYTIHAKGVYLLTAKWNFSIVLN